MTEVSLFVMNEPRLVSFDDMHRCQNGYDFNDAAAVVWGEDSIDKYSAMMQRVAWTEL